MPLQMPFQITLARNFFEADAALQFFSMVSHMNR
jgi:hypothetical protein